MLGALFNIFRVPDLRKKVLWTVFFCVIYRLGAHIPTPFLDQEKLADFFNAMRNSAGGGVLNVVDMFSGNAFSNMTILALGIMPYISTSIILQLMTVVIPKLERISKEGEAGRKKINQWTRYGTVILSLFQGLGLGIFLHRSELANTGPGGINTYFFLFTTALTMTAGTCFLMWLGEKITEYGIGNGISIIIAVSILVSYPSYVNIGFQAAFGENPSMNKIAFVAIISMLIFTTGLIILLQEASRKIPVQHARRVVGRKVMQGGSTFVPLKLNTAGVIPVIFASALLSFPQMLAIPFSGADQLGGDWFSPYSSHNVYDAFSMELGGVFNILRSINLYTIVYSMLVVFFCFFYTAVTFNPVDLADNLKKSGAFIPGKKPGKATSDYINYTLVRITMVGAFYLVGVSLIPNVITASFRSIDGNFASIAGGTGLIIIVGVFLDTLKQIESQLLMRHYEGFKYQGLASSAGRRSRR